MNMHHITKSLFVGAAIAGIGMSSGRAEVPLSGETRAWNATVKKLKPLYREAGVSFNSEKLRFQISQVLINELKPDLFYSLPGRWLSMRGFIDKLICRHVDSKLASIIIEDYAFCSNSFLRCILNENSDCVSQIPKYVAPIPLIFQLGENNKGEYSNEEARKLMDFLEKKHNV